MGITGLLPLLRPITKEVHIRKYRGKKVAVDAYVWLHRGAYACSSELCQNIPTDKYIKYCMKMINMLRKFEVEPYLVFDGAKLPAKLKTESSREENRTYNYEKGMSLLRRGRKSEADEHFRKAVDITPQMAYNLMQVLKENKVEFIVAPYEADAQLAYLARKKIVDAIITEDSDLIPYGAPCVLFKLNKQGYVDEILLKKLGSNTTPGFTFEHFSHGMFIRTCVLSGCDYLDSLTGIGLKKSHNLIKTYQHADRLKKGMQLNWKNPIPPSYFEKFKEAEMTFRFQRVWDPIEKKMTTLTPLPPNLVGRKLDFLGPVLEDDIVSGIVHGKLDPMTHEPFRNEMDYTKIQEHGYFQREQESVQQEGSILQYMKKKKGKGVFGKFRNPSKKKKSKKKRRRKKKKKKKKQKGVETGFFSSVKTSAPKKKDEDLNDDDDDEEEEETNSIEIITIDDEEEKENEKVPRPPKPPQKAKKVMMSSSDKLDELENFRFKGNTKKKKRKKKLKKENSLVTKNEGKMNLDMLDNFRFKKRKKEKKEEVVEVIEKKKEFGQSPETFDYSRFNDISPVKLNDKSGEKFETPTNLKDVQITFFSNERSEEEEEEEEEELFVTPPPPQKSIKKLVSPGSLIIVKDDEPEEKKNPGLSRINRKKEALKIETKSSLNRKRKRTENLEEANREEERVLQEVGYPNPKKRRKLDLERVKEKRNLVFNRVIDLEKEVGNMKDFEVSEEFLGKMREVNMFLQNFRANLGEKMEELDRLGELERASNLNTENTPVGSQIQLRNERSVESDDEDCVEVFPEQTFVTPKRATNLEHFFSN